MRKDAREIVYKVLYSELYNDDYTELFSELKSEYGLNSADSDFADRLLSTISEHRAEFEQIICELANNYKLERVYSTDKCALLIGLCELTYFEDVPKVVAIDEAMNLCRIFSTEKSLSFVNGIFAEYKKRLENK